MTYKEIAKRATATFIQAATSALVVSGFTDLPVLVSAAIAGGAAVISLAQRLSGRWLDAHPEG